MKVKNEINNLSFRVEEKISKFLTENNLVFDDTICVDVRWLDNDETVLWFSFGRANDGAVYYSSTNVKDDINKYNNGLFDFGVRHSVPYTTKVDTYTLYECMKTFRETAHEMLRNLFSMTPMYTKGHNKRGQFAYYDYGHEIAIYAAVDVGMIYVTSTSRSPLEFSRSILKILLFNDLYVTIKTHK